MLRASPGVLRHTLLSALGLLPLACGGSSIGSPGAGGSSSSAGTGGGSGGSGGQALGGDGMASAGTANGGAPDAGSGGVAVAGSGGSAGAGGAVTLSFPCEGSTSLAGASPGYAECEDGVWHRPEAVDCPPWEQEQPLPDGYGCIKDEDCGEGKICVCGQPSLCAEATCSTDSDCAPGVVCRGYSTSACDGPGVVLPDRFACQTAADACSTFRECENGMRCGADSGTFQCDVMPVNPACGRPFLVQGAARVAELRARNDWASPLKTQDAPRDAALGVRAGHEWARIGQLEHASIAAFARFTLQLLQLGAPAELVERATRALQDETRHAQLAFSLAFRFLGKPLGPAGLNVEQSLEDGSLSAVLRLVFQEGCVGETVAALQVQEAAAYSAEGLRSALQQVAQEEAEHAELAWRFVRWALEQDASLAGVVRDELARALGEQPSVSVADTDELLPFGILSSRLQEQLRVAALKDVVMPCALALLSQLPEAASERVASSPC